MNNRIACTIVLFSSILSSCHEEGSIKELIEGNWILSNNSVTGCLDRQYNVPEFGGGGPTYTFSSGKWNFTIPAYIVTGGPGCSHANCSPWTMPARVISGSYTIDGKTMFFEYEDGSPGVTYQVTVNTSALTLSKEIKYYYTTGCMQNINFIRQ